jgi:nucleoside-diphosphate-sugar epimerase
MRGLEWSGLRTSMPAAASELLASGTPVMVTGCAGFIGSHLCEALLKLDCRVVGIDSLNDYYDPAQKRENLVTCLADERFSFHHLSLQDCDLRPLMAGVRVCFHLAAQAGVRASWGDDFKKYLDWNILGTQRILETCRLPEVAGDLVRLVYSSSSSVYGDQPSYPVAEEDLPMPRSPYGVTKLAAEHLCELYSASYGVPTSSLRYFTVYGPRQRPDMAFRKCIEATLDGRPFAVYGDGLQTRDFTFVADAVRANLLAVAAPGVSQVMNIGGGARISLIEALRLLLAAVQRVAPERRLEIANEGAARGDVRHTAADCERAERLIGWKPEHGLADGLAQQVAWVAARRSVRES